MTEQRAVVVGAGPNGLAAAVVLARAGLPTTVYERASTIGGGARTAELTLPGFHHDLGSAVHPLALASQFFRQFELAERIELLTPAISFAHPLDEQPSVLAFRDLERTVQHLDSDGAAWRGLLEPLVRRADAVGRFTQSPLLRLPSDPATAVRFLVRALEQGTTAGRLRWRGERAAALFAGAAAHTVRRLPSVPSAGAGLALTVAGHVGGWPIPVGGSQAIVDALADDLRAHGGVIECGVEVTDVRELGSPAAVLFDVAPSALERIAGDALPARYRRRLRAYRHADGVAKLDLALSGPVPWSDPALREVVTLHLGGSARAIEASEAQVARGQHPDDPYVLVAQPSVLDPSRAPLGQHVLWAYTHVPRGSTLDRREAIIRQIERFAPGVRDLVVGASSATALDMQRQNPNFVGGDIAIGAMSIGQMIARPTVAVEPWRTPAAGIYLCSSATPPGPGVHGMAGFHAARTALRHEFGITRMPALAR